MIQKIMSIEIVPVSFSDFELMQYKIEYTYLMISL